MRNLFHLSIFLILISCFDCPERTFYELSDQFDVNPDDDVIPAVMSVDCEKNYIYIASPWQPKISKYNLQGKQIRLLDLTAGEQGNYDYYEPIDLIVDEASNIYTLTIPCIQDTDSTWGPLSGFGIIKYDNEFQYQNEFYFTEMDVSWFTTAMTYKNGILYITNGTHLMKINAENGSYTIFDLPKQNDENSYYHTSGMAIDGYNNIWIVGAYNWFPENSENWEVGVQITQFNSNFQYHKTFFAQSTTNDFGEVVNHPAICFDNDNNMYIATGFCQSIEIYDSNQEFQHEIIIEGDRSFPTDIAIDYNNNLYVLDSHNDRVLIYEPRG